MMSVAVFIIGFSSLFCQSLFVRELLVAFGGNEIAIGVILAGCLLWTGAGSFIFSRLCARFRNPARTLSIAHLVFTISIIAEFFLIRNLRILLGLTSGQIITPGSTLLVSLFALGPLMVANGFLFAVCIRIFSGTLHDKSIARVYSVDALGDMAGGLVFSFLFVFLLSPLENIFFVATLNCICMVVFAWVHRQGRMYKSILAVTVIALLVFGMRIDSIEKQLTQRLWKGFNVVDTTCSRFGNLVLTHYEDTFSLFVNGTFAFSFPSTLESEDQTHLTFLQSPLHRRLLLIGEGVKGLLTEALKYPFHEIHYCELDPALITFIKPYLSRKNLDALADPKVTVHNAEARFFLNRYKGKKFDVIMLHTPPPYTAYLNRFYTHEFFEKIKELLTPSGVFSFTIPSKEDYLTKELRDFNASIFHTLNQTFAQILLVPGENVRFIASASGKHLSDDPRILNERLRGLAIPTQFVNEFYLQTKLLPWHLEYIDTVIRKHTGVRLNYDFSPVSYYYGIGFFASHFRGSMRKIILFLSSLRLPVYLIAALLLATFFYLLRRKNSIAFSVFSMGAAGMAAVVITVLGFQIVYGYVYHKVGLISACFMFGVALSSRWVGRKDSAAKERLLMSCALSAALCMAGIPFIFKILQGHASSLQWISFILPACMGILVGGSFPLANMIYLKESKEVVKGAGSMYACDLVGGGASGFCLSLIFIPLYGLFASGMTISFLLFISTAYLWLFFASKNERV